ncbi:C-type mannose receptor 2-like isoform X1 [Hemibagrus wyckioides]|uniref:C-type mannose receptor 2-like isoform X1 n=1 Tax=Hemibagrus wyckioides TaxID=337641 RepID=UPI00266DCDAB|nr:C-type mannose receptor 2-like isoform X1 [Hemibagrus wyckioides]
MMNLFSFLCLIGFPFALSILDWTQVAPLLIKHLMTWPMAQNYCRTNHLDLYSITGPRDQVMLINEMNNHNEMVAVWTGLYNDLDNWYWSYNHLPLKNQSQWYFASGYPYNGYGLDVCGIINRNGQWETLSCYYTIPFICYDETNSYANRFVVYPQDTFNWFQAQSYCRIYHTDLAYTFNNDDVTLAVQCVYKTSYTGAWFGLTRDTWKWSNGRAPSYLPWSALQPDNYYLWENCGVAQDGLLFDAVCTNSYYFVCSAYLNKTQFLKLEVLSDASVLDPAVQSTILDLITQKLHENGMSVNTTVDWKVQSDGSIFHKKEQDKE